jgi:hypothetical protein
LISIYDECCGEYVCAGPAPLTISPSAVILNTFPAFGSLDLSSSESPLVPEVTNNCS